MKMSGKGFNGFLHRLAAVAATKSAFARHLYVCIRGSILTALRSLIARSAALDDCSCCRYPRRRPGVRSPPTEPVHLESASPPPRQTYMRRRTTNSVHKEGFSTWSGHSDYFPFIIPRNLAIFRLFLGGEMARVPGLLRGKQNGNLDGRREPFCSEVRQLT
jgi:hypothetical protein